MNHDHNVEGFQLIAELSIQDSFDSNKCRLIHDSLPIQTVIIQYVLTQFCGVLTVEEQLSHMSLPRRPRGPVWRPELPSTSRNPEVCPAYVKDPHLPEPTYGALDRMAELLAKLLSG